MAVFSRKQHKDEESNNASNSENDSHDNDSDDEEQEDVSDYCTGMFLHNIFLLALLQGMVVCIKLHCRLYAREGQIPSRVV